MAFVNLSLFNLETDDAKIFEGERNIHRLVDRIFFEKQALKNETDTLIFIDEIQEVPTALNMLRYFYEEYPQYYVVAAGSLLESLFNQNISFPVGRVDYLYMYPFSFSEFLEAMGGESSMDSLPHCTCFRICSRTINAALSYIYACRRHARSSGTIC